MHILLAVSLAILPPEAATHNDRAVSLFDAGDLDGALDEFARAYAAMPDPRVDRDGREQVLGSMRGLLLRQHRATGAARPLCRLRDLLSAHIATLRTASSDVPQEVELAGDQERLAEVERQLAAYPTGVCGSAPTTDAPPPEPVASGMATPAASEASDGPPVAPVSDVGAHVGTARADGSPSPRHLRIAGGVTLGLCAASLAVMAQGIAAEQRRAAHARSIEAGAGGRPFTPAERDSIAEDLERARGSRVLAIGAGVAAVATAALGTALLIVARRGRADRRVSVAPWWLSSGTGVHIQLRLP